MSNLHVSIKSNEAVLFDSDITSLTSFNEKGRFDILSFHANFISIITNKIIIYHEKGKTEFPVDKGVLKAYENKIEIFLGIDVL